MKKNNYILLILVSILLVFAFFAFYEHLKFNHYKAPIFYDNELKVWAHRGSVNNVPENTIASFTQAFNLGATGTELDVHFDTRQNVFIVAHDFSENTQESEPLLLEDVFRQFGNEKYYWIDFKELSRLSTGETELAVARLLELISRYKLQNKIIVEGQKANRLGMFAKAGIATSYWIGLKEQDNFLEFLIEKTGVYFFITRHNFSAVSMRYQYYTPKVEDALKKMPVHLFTVNSKEVIEQLIEKENVKIILSDSAFYNLQ